MEEREGRTATGLTEDESFALAAGAMGRNLQIGLGLQESSK